MSRTRESLYALISNGAAKKKEGKEEKKKRKMEKIEKIERSEEARVRSRSIFPKVVTCPVKGMISAEVVARRVSGAKIESV